MREGNSFFRAVNERRDRRELRQLTEEALRDKGELSMNELASELGYARLTNTLREVVHEMIDEGKAQYLYPDKPRSRNQRIRLAGRNS